MNKLVEVLAEQFNCTIEYAKAHIPELMHDYCVYKGIVNTAGVVVCLATIIACIVFVKMMLKNRAIALEQNEDTFFFQFWHHDGEVTLKTSGGFAICAVAIALGMGLIGIWMCSVVALEAFFFPNVFILERVLEVV